MEEVEKKRQTVEELYSLRNAKIEEEEAIRRNIKSSFKDIEAEYLSASIHPENDNNIVLFIKSGFSKRYDQVLQVATHFLTMNLETFGFSIQNTGFANVDPIRFANELSMFISSIQNDTIGLRKQIKELEGKKEYLKTIQGQIALEEMKAKEGVVSKDISISGEFTKNLRHGDVIYPIDIMFKGRDYFYPAYYKVKKVNPVNIVIDVLSTNNYYDASSGKNLINAAFENVSITPFNVKMNEVPDININREYIENLIGGEPNKFTYLTARISQGRVKTTKRKYERSAEVFSKEWVIISKKEWEKFNQGQIAMFDYLLDEMKNDKVLSQFGVRWLAHEFIVRKKFEEFEKLVGDYTRYFKPENMYLKQLLVSGQREVIMRLFKDYEFDEKEKDFVVAMNDSRAIKTAIDIGVKFNSDKYVIEALKKNNVEIAKLLLDNGCPLREKDANELMNNGRTDEIVKKFIKVNVFMKGMFN